MTIVEKLKQLFAGRPVTAEELEESQRVRDAVETTRLSQRSGSAGENYQSGRGPGA